MAILFIKLVLSGKYEKEFLFEQSPKNVFPSPEMVRSYNTPFFSKRRNEFFMQLDHCTVQMFTYWSCCAGKIGRTQIVNPVSTTRNYEKW
jgi:hypothetical protein